MDRKEFSSPRSSPAPKPVFASAVAGVALYEVAAMTANAVLGFSVLPSAVSAISRLSLVKSARFGSHLALVGGMAAVATLYNVDRAGRNAERRFWAAAR